MIASLGLVLTLTLKRAKNPNKQIKAPTRRTNAMTSLPDLARGRNKILTKECAITRHEIFCADECFLTGTAAEIIPVVKVDGRTIGTGKPGELTLKLIKLFHGLTKTDGVKY